MQFLMWLEETGLAVWVRESASLLAYPTILLLHTIGLAIVVGISAGINLRLLGFAPGVPLSPLARLYPYMWTGFWINAVSGGALVVADASRALTNPVFFIKMVLIALAVNNLRLLKPHLLAGAPAGAPRTPNRVRMLAFTSLVLWVAAITAGRLIAYISV
jgi:hypothetical protein